MRLTPRQHYDRALEAVGWQDAVAEALMGLLLVEMARLEQGR
jgi:hypothetical protein